MISNQSLVTSLLEGDSNILVQVHANALLFLFFIIFKSASTALAFEALLYHNVSLEPIRKLADGLAALMLIGLLAWTMNLSVNVFRVIEKLGGREDDGHV